MDISEYLGKSTKTLEDMHGRERFQNLLTRSKDILDTLYGKEGEERFRYLCNSLSRFIEQKPSGIVQKDIKGRDSEPFEEVDGRLFAIAYADNVYNNKETTLKTLDSFLSEHFPSVNGIHILPERVMCHDDVWPQDFFPALSPKESSSLHDWLTEAGVINAARRVTPLYENKRDSLPDELSTRYSDDAAKVASAALERAYSAHFNDGGFSQIDRSVVDPRFGDKGDLTRLSEKYSIMLDFVANHLDIDNPRLEAFRRGDEDGDSFLIISPETYQEYRETGLIDKTFRPRPFPLFTGLRKYPVNETLSLDERVDIQNNLFVEAGLTPLDKRFLLFLTIWFKVRNDQGLNAEEKRIFNGFTDFLDDSKKSVSLFEESLIQPGQKKLLPEAGCNMKSFFHCLDEDKEYAGIFVDNQNELWGEPFFVYTTFSESQVDIYPKTFAGYKLAIDDLFELLSGGDLAMLRLDAIKYLWKVPGGRNFDTPEGNLLIELNRLMISLATPRVLPLDEVNSPDSVVYEMGKEGGFSYLFGEVNAVVSAFNLGTINPLKRMINLMENECPDNLTLFVMLSTHDGRSVQGVGVPLESGALTFEEYEELCKTIEANGGKAKLRSVKKGEIEKQTFRKACYEMGANNIDSLISGLFTESGETITLKDPDFSREKFINDFSVKANKESGEIGSHPAMRFITQWLFEGVTHYELCATSRDALSVTDTFGKPLTPEEEAARLACAQAYVFTLGQVVPAIYLNDLMGIGNNIEGYKISGRPRDINRKKTYLPDWRPTGDDKRFFDLYREKINALVTLRTCDKAFYPGGKNFEFQALTPSIFLNHAYEREEHSLIIGNLLNEAQDIFVRLSDLKDFSDDQPGKWCDCLTNKSYSATDGVLNLSVPPYGILWLK